MCKLFVLPFGHFAPLDVLYDSRTRRWYQQNNGHLAGVTLHVCGKHFDTFAPCAYVCRYLSAVDIVSHRKIVTS